MNRSVAAWALFSFAVGAICSLPLRAENSLVLTNGGVSCDLGPVGTFTLGIPALDGRKTHAPALSASIQTDGKTLTAKYGAPFEGVALTMKILDGGNVQYRYTGLPEDLHIVMCQFNLPTTSIVPGLTVSFDHSPPKEIPAEPGKTNHDVNLVSTNAQTLEIDWPTGEALLLTSPKCWHGIQDSRVWGKKFIGICLTPPVKRDAPGGDTSTLVMTFGLKPPTASKPSPTAAPAPAATP